MHIMKDMPLNLLNTRSFLTAHPRVPDTANKQPQTAFVSFQIFLDHLPQCCNQNSFIDFSATSVHPTTRNQTLSHSMWYVDMYIRVYVCEYLCVVIF